MGPYVVYAILILFIIVSIRFSVNDKYKSKQLQAEMKTLDLEKDNKNLKHKISQLEREISQHTQQENSLKVYYQKIIREKESQLIDCQNQLSNEVSNHACMLSLKKSEFTKLQNEHQKTQSEKRKLENELAYYKNLHNKRSNTLNQIFESNLTAFPYLAGIMADYKTLELDIMIKELSWGDNIERKKKVASLSTIKKEVRNVISECKIAEYELAYIKQLFPIVEDMLSVDFKEIDTTIKITDTDPVRSYVSRDEYQSLNETERNQLALDRYIESRSKSKWQIGRDYELYIGYKYQSSGYVVDYFGSYMGIEDLGRDLIATKDGQTLIIQCKYWSKEKEIHEKHMAQLYGTYICYCLENNISTENVHPVFITSTKISTKAKEFADFLNISFKEFYPLGEFPRIKCNVNTDIYGQKTFIYHLPIDQQYDSVKIDKKDECFAFTVQEAELKGFRRAYRWHADL